MDELLFYGFILDGGNNVLILFFFFLSSKEGGRSFAHFGSLKNKAKTIRIFALRDTVGY